MTQQYGVLVLAGPRSRDLLQKLTDTDLSTAAFPWLSLGELGLAVYSGYGTYLAVHQGAYLLIPFLLLYTLGFAAVAGLSLYEGFQKEVGPHRA